MNSLNYYLFASKQRTERPKIANKPDTVYGIAEAIKTKADQQPYSVYNMDTSKILDVMCQLLVNLN